MFGFLVGFASLAGLIAVAKGGRRGCGASWHGGSCHGGGGWHGRSWHGHRGGHHRGGGFAPRRMMRFMFERLDTTPSQEKEVVGAFNDLVERARELRREGKHTRDDVVKLLRTDSLDENVLGELFGRHDERVREIQKAFADALGRVHQALDADQRAELATLLEGFRGPRGSWA